MRPNTAILQYAHPCTQDPQERSFLPRANVVEPGMLELRDRGAEELCVVLCCVVM